jgi:hypothetical protein
VCGGFPVCVYVSLRARACISAHVFLCACMCLGVRMRVAVPNVTVSGFAHVPTHAPVFVLREAESVD